MHRQLSAWALALALAASGALSATEPAKATRVAVAKAQESARTDDARNYLRSLESQMGLSASTDFEVHHAFTNEQGVTIVRIRSCLDRPLSMWHPTVWFRRL